MQTIKMTLPVKLTDTEVAIRASELAKVVVEKADLEQDKGDHSKAFTSDIKKKQLRIVHLSTVVTTRTEAREVDCYEVADFEKKVVAIIRADTGEQVDQREVTDKDRQQQMFGSGELRAESR